MAPAAGRRSWALLGGLGLLVVLNPAGCGKAGPAAGGSVDPALLVELLAAVGPQVVEPALLRFVDEATALLEQVEAWADAEEAGDGSGLVPSAQEAWFSTFAAWQELELMQIGPAASSLSARGGQDLRDEIYSWPTVSGCRVDQVTVAGDYAEAEFFSSSLVNAYGLDAAEHLLFFGPDNDCPNQVDINAEGSWDALGADEVQARRAEYAEVVVAEVLRQGRELEQTWAPQAGDFSGSLAAGTDPYASPQSALNAVYDALFYLETATKDRKLAQPLGLQECSEATCPEDVEARTSGAGLLAIEANLLGFQALLTGGEGSGMDELLVELGHETLAQELVEGTEAALVEVGALEGPLDSLIETDPEAVQELHDALKVVTDLVKGDLATVLSVSIPDEAAGDND